MEGKKDDEDDLPGTPEGRDLDDECEEQIPEMLEIFIATQDMKGAEGMVLNTGIKSRTAT